MTEARTLGKTWWCRGGGAAVLMLLAVVSFFRAPRDLIFWAAILFFFAHTAMALRRYLNDRRARTTATVIRHLDSQPVRVRPAAPMVFINPRPITSLIRVDLPPK